MAGWQTHMGKALHLPADNIDTDQLIPARFMSQPRSEGYGGFLLHDMRRDAAGVMREDFPLNRYNDITVLVAGRNFGSGSSREAAVYALVDAGIRAVIAPGFGDIFAGNAVNNGLLPAEISSKDADAIAHLLSGRPSPVRIDLADGLVEFNGHAFGFTLADNWRTKLINGWDDIDLTLQQADAIERYKTKRKNVAGWTWPAAST